MHNAAPLEIQAVSTIIWCLTQSHYPDTEPTSHCHILIKPSTWLRSDKYQFHKSSIWFDNGFEPTIGRTRMQDTCSTDLTIASGCIVRWNIKLSKPEHKFKSDSTYPTHTLVRLFRICCCTLSLYTTNNLLQVKPMIWKKTPHINMNPACLHFKYLNCGTLLQAKVRLFHNRQPKIVRLVVGVLRPDNIKGLIRRGK